MAHILAGVAGLLHGAQEHDLDHESHGQVLDAVQKIHQGPGVPVGFFGEHQPQFGDKLPEHGQLVRVGDVVHPEDGGLAQILRHRLVGRNHKFFDDLMRQQMVQAADVVGDALIVQQHFRLGDGQEQAAPLPALPPQQAAELRHLRQHLDQLPAPFPGLPVPSLQDLLHFVIGQPCLAADDRPGEFRRLQPSGPIEGENHRHGQTVHAGIEAADAGGQFRRQHGQDGLGKVDAGAPFFRLLIQGRARLDIIGHIGDGHVEHKAAARFFQEGDAVIKVPGVQTVDGDHGEVPQVQASLTRGFRHFLGRGPGLAQGRGRKFVRQLVFQDDHLHLDRRVLRGCPELPRSFPRD